MTDSWNAIIKNWGQFGALQVLSSLAGEGGGGHPWQPSKVFKNSRNAVGSSSVLYILF